MPKFAYVGRMPRAPKRTTSSAKTVMVRNVNFRSPNRLKLMIGCFRASGDGGRRGFISTLAMARQPRKMKPRMRIDHA